MTASCAYRLSGRLCRQSWLGHGTQAHGRLSARRQMQLDLSCLPPTRHQCVMGSKQSLAKTSTSTVVQDSSAKPCSAATRPWLQTPLASSQASLLLQVVYQPLRRAWTSVVLRACLEAAPSLGSHLPSPRRLASARTTCSVAVRTCSATPATRQASATATVVQTSA
jgi:hypothetical protein